MGGRYLISGRATESGLTELHELIDRVRLDHPELDQAELAMLETAVIEVAGNVVEHGSPPGGITYQFALEVSARGLYGSLYDSGDQVVLPPEPDEHDPLAESGRGLGLARAVLTELRYERQGDRNAWILTRLAAPRPSGDREDSVEKG